MATIRNDDGTITAICDCCDHRVKLDARRRRFAHVDLARKGWVSTKLYSVDGEAEWWDLCPLCGCASSDDGEQQARELERKFAGSFPEPIEFYDQRRPGVHQCAKS